MKGPLAASLALLRQLKRDKRSLDNSGDNDSDVSNDEYFPSSDSESDKYNSDTEIGDDEEIIQASQQKQQTHQC